MTRDEYAQLISRWALDYGLSNRIVSPEDILILANKLASLPNAASVTPPDDIAGQTL